MKKKSVVAIILRAFAKTLGVLFLLVAVVAGSYYGTLKYYYATERTERSTTYTPVIDRNPGVNSVNLIYSVDAKTRSITGILLEVLNKDTKNLDYFTIPANTELELSADLYTKLLSVTPELPQIVMLSKLNNYFDGYTKVDQNYEYGIKILEDALGINIGYFTTLSSTEFAKYFTNPNASDEQPCYRYTDSFMKTVSGLNDESAVSDFMSAGWDSIYTDLTLNQKVSKYASAFAAVNKKFIYFYKAPILEKKNGYDLDVSALKKMVKRSLSRDAYTKAQTIKTQTSSKTNKSEVSSKKLKIIVLNASGVNGLAASIKEKLESEGFTIDSIGNYEGESQKETKIVVRKKKTGSDLLEYFEDAEVEQSAELKDGIDIEVIIGSEDSNQVAGY